MVRISSFCHRKAELEVNQCKFKHAILSKSSYRRASSLILPNIFFSSHASRLLLSEFRSCHKSLYYSIQNLSQEAHRWPPLSSNHNLNKRAKIVIIHRVPGKNLWQDISKWMRCYWLVASPAPYLECSQTLIDLRYLGWEKALEGSMESTSQMSLHTSLRAKRRRLFGLQRSLDEWPRLARPFGQNKEGICVQGAVPKGIYSLVGGTIPPCRWGPRTDTGDWALFTNKRKI